VKLALAGGIQSRANDHVRSVREYRLKQGVDARRGVSAVSIQHDIDVCVNLAKHTLHDESLALTPLMEDDGTVLKRALHCGVGGVIVENVDLRDGQLSTNAFDDVCNRRFFVEAWNQDGDSW
jgi:hypothetical protein